MRSFRPPSRPGALLLDPPAPAAPAAADGVAYPAVPAPGSRDPLVGRGYPAESDPVGRLPPTAAAKLIAITTAQDDANVLQRDLSERVRLCGNTRRDLASRLDAAVRAHRGPGSVAATQLTREIEAIDAELTALRERLTRAQARRSGLPQRLVEFLRAVPGDVVLQGYPTSPAPVLSKGQTLPLAISAAREKLGELRADLHEIQSRPLPSTQVKARVRAEIAARATPLGLMHAVEFGGAVVWPVANVQGQVQTAGGIGLAVMQATDSVGLFCWVFGNQLIAAAEAEIDLLSDDEHALDDAQRARIEAEIAAKILATERQEEALIMLGEQQGLEVRRRDDASPLAVLGLASSLPAPAR